MRSPCIVRLTGGPALLRSAAMTILVTGSAGHLGEALMRSLRESGREARGLDVLASPFTDQVDSITDRAAVRRAMAGVRVVLHTATLHKPHVATHSRQDFVDVNISGTLNLLEEAAASGIDAFVYTSTTSVFGDAMAPPAGRPAAWVTEAVVPEPKNIYGVTKNAAEDLCRLFHRNHGLAAIVLRTSRFFPEEDDNSAIREGYEDANAKANEYLYRRVAIEDVASAHLLAAERGRAIGFGLYIVSATSPFRPEDLAELRGHAEEVAARRVPGYRTEYARRGWRIFPDIDRVYVNERARRELGWQPRVDFAAIVERLREGGDLRGPLARAVGAKGYHAETFADGPYPVEKRGKFR
jgi:nucleoside-diphosphate-sugar epimerase